MSGINSSFQPHLLLLSPFDLTKTSDTAGYESILFLSPINSIHQNVLTISVYQNPNAKAPKRNHNTPLK